MGNSFAMLPICARIRWTDYRSREHPDQIRIEHHKTGKLVLHSLEEVQRGKLVRFYEEAEAILAKLPRRGTPMILREIDYPDGRRASKLFSFSGFEKIVQTMRRSIDGPRALHARRLSARGMTELEEAELTDGQGRALSAHTSKAYEGYAKRAFKRALAATRKRYAGNERFQNENRHSGKSAK
jgi:hypothetical protein